MAFEKEDNWGDVLPYRRPGLVWVRHREGNNVYYSSIVDGDTWLVRLNDFPDEPLHTLMVDGKEIIHFNDWPKEWRLQRPSDTGAEPQCDDDNLNSPALFLKAFLARFWRRLRD